MSRGIADISAFLKEAEKHVTGTGQDKYAKDRKFETSDVLNEWFGDCPFLWNACKYLSRLPRTKNPKDFYKAVHYIGMEYNRVIGPTVSLPSVQVEPTHYQADHNWVANSAKTGENALSSPDLNVEVNGPSWHAGWQIKNVCKETLIVLDWFMEALLIFDARHKVRGPANINRIGAKGCLDHAEEKAIRAKATLERLLMTPEGQEYDKALLKDFTDSCLDGPNFFVMALMKFMGEWPPNPTPGDTGKKIDPYGK